VGNVNAAVAATNISRSFKVKRLAMIGIAGGCPDHAHLETHVRLGDVVIASKTIEWDHQKRTQNGEVECRDTPHQIGHDWMQAVRLLQNEAHTFARAWQAPYRRGLRRQQIQAPAVAGDILRDHDGAVVGHPPDPRRKTVPHLVHLGVIGAGDTLLKDPKLRDQLRDEHKIRAVEMESSGIQAAEWAHNGSFVAVRGIVDYCDGHKSDDWHRSAATAAAAVTYLMFKTLLIAEGGGTA
jgi:nucleoside phosphorylase